MTYLDLPLYPDQPARPNVGIETGIDRGLRLIAEVGTPLVSVFVADNPTGAVAVICPGGGYRRVCLDKEGLDVARLWARWGITTLVLTYRQPGGVFHDPPLPLADLRRAFQIAATGDWPFDASRFILAGFSAGGHLALTALREPAPGPQPRWAVLGYPVAGFFPPLVHEMSRDNFVGAGAPEALVARFSADRGPAPDLAGAFLLHADDDRSVPLGNSLALQSLWSAAGIPVTLVRHPTGGHGFGLGPSHGYPEAPDWSPRLHAWFAANGCILPL